ncbi:MAG: L,D-transpeptidase [Actinomycetota bacterium]|nr:L,D-transpeptidase [Actinomycetota bacterium]
MSGRRPVVGVLAALIVVLLASSGAVLVTGAADQDRKPETATYTAPAQVRADPPKSVVAAALVSSVGVYESPEAPRPTRSIANPNENGAPLVFLVEENKGEWLRVLLPVRPNGSTGWIRSRDVRLGQHSFRIVVELSAHRITVMEGANVFLTEPIGVGKNNTPTPGGVYYVKELLRPPSPNGPYGPFAYGLSGFSNQLTNFAGGEGVIGIHGTNDPASLGKDVSSGCIRMSNAGITRLTTRLPLGTPVDIRP